MITLLRQPIPHLVISNFFSKKENKLILDEAVKNKKSFTESITGKGVDKKYRNNKVAYYDQLYMNDRKQSKLLVALDNKFATEDFRQILSTSPHPLSDFTLCTYHETQVSRYGEEEKYKWHIDRFDNIKRHITLVYYFFETPKKFKGGELELTDSPAFNANLIDTDPNIEVIPVENNMAVMFACTGLHRVTPTKALKDFRSGRFSANVWIGFR